MKTGLFFIILAAVVAAALISGCKAQTEPPKQPEQPQENATECVSDSDCGVGGCSGQVCTAASEAAGVITTCEYRAEYDCLKLTGCGCVNGKCAWKETADYKACVETTEFHSS